MSKLDDIRCEIDACDRLICDAYVRRLKLVEQVADYKKNNNVQILNTSREAEVIENVLAFSGEYKDDVKSLFEFIMNSSKDKQSDIIN